MTKSKNISWRGLVLLLPLLLLFSHFYKQIRFRNRMKQINLIYGLLLAAGFSQRLARYVCAQAAHETGDFNSKIFRLNNNLFGMKLPKIRKTTALYEQNGHAVYESPESSIEDFIIYWKAQNYSLDFNSPDLFVEAIHKRGYFEADIREYKKGVNFFYNKYFKADE